MKLIDPKKMKEQIFLWDTSKRPPGGIGFRQQIYDLMDKSLLDPADLEMAVLGAWEKLKKHIIRGKENCDRANEPCVYSLYAVVEKIIADLESGLDPEKWRKIREDARAWRWLLSKGDLFFTVGRSLKTEMTSLRTQAQAELTLPASFVPQDKSARAKEKGEDDKSKTDRVE